MNLQQQRKLLRVTLLGILAFSILALAISLKAQESAAPSVQAGTAGTSSTGQAGTARSDLSSLSADKPTAALAILGVGVLLGAGGQTVRVVIGLKKEMDQAPGQDWGKWFNASQLVVSMLLGGAAGLLYAVYQFGAEINKQYLLGGIAAGYAGADFIEGLMSKYLPGGTSSGAAAGGGNTATGAGGGATGAGSASGSGGTAGGAH
jgi:hypothetical protein